MTVDTDRARSLLGRPELAWLVERCRQRLSRGAPLTGTVTLASASPDERDAADRLLGRRPTRGSSLRLDLDQVADVLRRSGIAERLDDAITAVAGPVTDVAAAQAAEAERWADTFAALRTEVAADPRLVAFVDDLHATGLLRRLTDGDAGDARRLATRALEVVSALPVGGVPLARFAADTVGDSHALDPGRPLATVALRAVEHLTGDVRGDRSAAERRALWARVGVLCDELSGAALVLGLHGAGTGPTDVILSTAAAAGEPVRVTLRQLVRRPPALEVGTVWICENPTIVALAADRLGSGSPALVCTDGQPSGAVQTLLRQLRDAGAELRVHVDLDWGGIRIANLLVDRFGARPWRLGCEDYLAAPTGVALRGRPATATWSPELTDAMQRRGTSVHEEQLADLLLEDLAASR